MRPVVSEFSYGYAVTEEFVKGAGDLIGAPPEFPSLLSEGKDGAGYDVAVHADFTLFLQFKMSHLMVRKNAWEISTGIFTKPFFRMAITPWWESKQHDLLLRLEKKARAEGDRVFYAAPMFHKFEEFAEAYAMSAVVDRSLFLPPSAIGTLTDEIQHHVAFDQSNVVVCSEPHTITRKVFRGPNLKKSLSKNLRPAGAPGRHDGFRHLSESMWDLARRYSNSPIELKARETIIRDRRPVEQIRFLASSVFGCEALFVGRRGP
jgi:hypothetical protein